MPTTKALKRITDAQAKTVLQAVWSLNSAHDAIVAAGCTPAQANRITAARDLLFDLIGGTD